MAYGISHMENKSGRSQNLSKFDALRSKLSKQDARDKEKTASRLAFLRETLTELKAAEKEQDVVKHYNELLKAFE